VQSEILAAFLYAQLEAMDEINRKRLEIWNKYYLSLQPLEEAGVIRLPIIPDYAMHHAHIFYVLFQEQSVRDMVMKQLQDAGIHAVFHYIPLHSSPTGISRSYYINKLYYTDECTNRILRLPIYSGLTDDFFEYIVKKIEEILVENN
jgi:dTDP-4-amino-4,6-dideoxygalactose transaminase